MCASCVPSLSKGFVLPPIMMFPPPWCDVPSGVLRRGLHASSVASARVLCSDPIDSVCPEILRGRGHTVDLAGDKPIPAADLKKVIGEYDALVIRR